MLARWLSIEREPATMGRICMPLTCCFVQSGTFCVHPPPAHPHQCITEKKKLALNKQTWENEIWHTI